MHAGDRLLHRLHALAEADAFETAGHRDVPLQILAADFGLAGFDPEIAPPNPASRFFRWKLMIIVFGSGRATSARSSGKRTRIVYERPVDDHRRGGGLALQNRAGIQFDFLRRETGARGDHRIHVHHERRAADGVLDAVLDVFDDRNFLDPCRRLSAPTVSAARDSGRTA